MIDIFNKNRIGNPKSVFDIYINNEKVPDNHNIWDSGQCADNVENVILKYKKNEKLPSNYFGTDLINFWENNKYIGKKIVLGTDWESNNNKFGINIKGTIGDCPSTGDNRFYDYNFLQNLSSPDINLYYIDNNNNKVDNFLPLGTDTFKLIKETIPPINAKEFGFINNTNNICVSKMSLGGIYKEFKNKCYSFGILSDIHQDADDDSMEEENDLCNALGFFNGKIDFVCTCGDLAQSYNPSQVYEDLIRYKEIIESEAHDYPVFTAKGNHDYDTMKDITDPTDRKSAWKTYSWPGNKITSNFKINGLENNTDITNTENFYFEYNDDVFIFLPIGNTGFFGGGNAYNPNNDYEIFQWLQQVLDNNRNKRCFLFTHLFFEQNTGNTSYNNFYNQKYPGDYKGKYGGNGIINTPMIHWTISDEGKLLQRIAAYYNNCIWFSGHSHFKWDLQKKLSHTDFYCNIHKVHNTYHVHVPSCAYSRSVKWGGDNKRYDLPGSSEGGIVEVYHDYVDIRGIVFKINGQNYYINNYEPCAQYRIPIPKHPNEIDHQDWSYFESELNYNFN